MSEIRFLPRSSQSAQRIFRGLIGESFDATMFEDFDVEIQKQTNLASEYLKIG